MSPKICIDSQSVTYVVDIYLNTPEDPVEPEAAVADKEVFKFVETYIPGVKDIYWQGKKARLTLQYPNIEAAQAAKQDVQWIAKILQGASVHGS